MITFIIIFETIVLKKLEFYSNNLFAEIRETHSSASFDYFKENKCYQSRLTEHANEHCIIFTFSKQLHSMLLVEIKNCKVNFIRNIYCRKNRSHKILYK